MAKRVQGFVIGIVFMTILSSVSFASIGTSSINVLFNQVKVQVNGKPVSGDNILYNGTTYLPLRNVAALLDKEIDWEQSTRTIYIREKDDSPSPSSLTNSYDENLIHGIKIGDSLDDLLLDLGEPQRIDSSAYDFKWYIYNKDYINYLQVGVYEQRIVAIYTNTGNWLINSKIGIGSTRNDVQKELGQPLSELVVGKYRVSTNVLEKKSTNLYLIGEEYTLFFFDILDNDKLVSIFKMSKNLPDKNIFVFLGYYDRAVYDKEIISAMEKQLFDLVNSARAVKGLELLSRDILADYSSREHSLDMAANNFFDHTNLRNQTPFERMRNAGITFQAAAENIAAGQSDSIYAHEGLKISEGHRKQIFGDFTKLGIGIAKGGEYGIYYTQNFFK